MADQHDDTLNRAPTDYEVGQDNVEIFGLDVHNPVFFVSGLTIVAFVILTLMFQDAAGTFFGNMRAGVLANFDAFLLSAGNIFVLFCLLLIVTPLGNVRLGGRDARPDYTYVGWFAMLFAAGMGIGLVFFGVGEPVSHYTSSLGGVAVEGGVDSVVLDESVRTDWAPLGAAEASEAGARNLGMAATLYHWGLHPWSIYAVVALALAFFAYNRGLPLTLRSAFYPLLGDRVWGWPGHAIDILAVFATLFGLATSLGFGTEQALAGLNFLFGTPTGGVAKVVLIGAITAIALVSVIRGLDGGVKVLSEVNMGLAALLLLFIILVGPTFDIFRTFFAGSVEYARSFIPLSNPLGREDVNFSQGWSAFYWAWWISWSPFVGMFIARVSRGRTVREFIVCVTLIPTLVCALWMSAFGGTAISQLMANASAAVGSAPLELQLFEMLSVLPLAQITSFLGIVLVLVFFVTSSDSGSLVIDTITAGGKTEAPVAQRVFWCTFEGVVAATLLLVGGAQSLDALQAMAVSTGLPFAVVLLVMCVSVFIGLNNERKRDKAALAPSGQATAAD